MSKKTLSVKFFLSSLLVFSLSCGSNLTAASKKKNTSTKNGKGQVTATFTNEEKSEAENTISSTEGAVKLPSQKRTYFYKINPEIISGVENGSPESLRLAMSKIRKNESEYEENEKVLIYVAAEIMNRVWKSEKINWEVFVPESENPYVGAIYSIDKSVFDSSTGNEDFLTTILPALVVLTPGLEESIYMQCKDSIEQALTRNSSSVLANYLMGVLQEKFNDYLSAVYYYRKAFENTSNCREIIFAYSRSLRLAGDLQNASKVLLTINGQENDIEVLKQNAYIGFAENNIQKAEEYVARVLQQNPTDLEFLLFRAKILIEKKDYIHAVSLLDMYARQDASSLEYLILRAKVQLDWSKNTLAATETIEKTLQLYPENIDALMIAAKISSITDSPVAGKYADELAEKVLEKDNSNMSALVYALNGLVKRENWQSAYEISKALVGVNYDSESILRHVEICLKLNKNSEAFEVAKKYHDMYPEDEVVLMAYILAYSKTGSRDNVIKYLDSLTETANPKMKSYIFYRRSFLQFSEDKILADLRSSLISNPRNSDSLFRLYEIYFDKQDYRKAQYYLRQVVAINPNDSSVKKLNEALTKLIN